MSRSESREAAFMLLFENMFRNEDPDDIIDTAVVADLFDISDDADKRKPRFSCRREGCPGFPGAASSLP